MADAALEIVPERREKGPLDRYKNQSLILKEFGEQGLEVYNAIDGKRTAGDLLKETGIEEGKFVKILEFMEKNGIITVSTVGVEKPKVEEKPEEKPKKPSKKPPREEVPPKEKPPKKPPVEEEKPPEEEEVLIIKPIPEEAPVEEEAEEEKVEEEVEEKVEEEAPPVEEEKLPIEEEAPPVKKKKPEELSPFEKIIQDKYGDIGVEIYNLIDGEKTAEEILVETGISEVKLVEILEFMDSQGIIRLEKPEEEEVKKPAPERVAEFKPITEEAPFQKEEEAKMGVAGELVEMVPIDVPMRVELNIMQKAQLTFLLTSKYRDRGLKVYNAIDGTKNMIDLSVEIGLSLNDLDLMFGDLGKRNMLLFRTLTREDVEGRYGASGFAVYKRYGRDGILLYEMIGKAESLKDIIMRSGMDPKKAIDVFLFIHKVLGIDIPLDRKALYAQLGLREEQP
jgi:hypothetical protein